MKLVCIILTVAEILSKNEETDRGKELLSATIEISSLMQECLPVCEKFLFRYKLNASRVYES